MRALIAFSAVVAVVGILFSLRNFYRSQVEEKEAEREDFSDFGKIEKEKNTESEED